MTATTETTAPILIIGGTGKTGKRVAERLTALGRQVRIGSRSAQPAFDWERPETWPAALEGASAAYITYYPDLTIPGAPEAIEAFVHLALDRGVKRLVLLSGRGEPEAQRSEEMLKASGADWTILSCAWFAQNFSEGFLFEALLEDTVRLPAGPVPEPFVDADDIADVAVAALTQAGHAGKYYELTGPEAITFETAIEQIAQAAGRDIRFEQMAIEDFTAGLHAAGVPQVFIDLEIELFTEVLDGRNVAVADGVRQALGREPRSFAQYVRETAATGVWNREA
ncbi:NmrA family transcriptional regulator [Devosia geojensis]|uniref:NmrA family transcriptional regulator n=1 Tax=Devosia geojensis TaxID=443610 RepID=A0A0F5FV57_9HYPH|nr:NAD(P)H-binding protein [Devosia geojensis]KKB12744.1 NmrA family transcriptional regulator [Devosia geojensis]